MSCLLQIFFQLDTPQMGCVGKHFFVKLYTSSDKLFVNKIFSLDQISVYASCGKFPSSYDLIDQSRGGTRKQSSNESLGYNTAVMVKFFNTQTIILPDFLTKLKRKYTKNLFTLLKHPVDVIKH